jgi:magnesium transporter
MKAGRQKEHRKSRAARRREFENRPTTDVYHRQLFVAADAHPTQVRVLAYGPNSFEERDNATIEEACRLHEHHPIVWIDVTGLANVPMLEQIADRFHLHPLTLEDVIRTHQRAKIEEFKEHLFVVARMAPLPHEETTEQISIFLGDDYVMTFQERPGDALDEVRHRIRTGRGKLRECGPDYLLYAILDATIDAYFPLLEDSGERLEDLEDDIVLRPRGEVLSEIYDSRRKMLMLRRALWPLREVTAALIRENSPRITPDTRIFLRDCYDHTIQIIDLLETYRELSSGMMDVYLSSMSNRLNEIMKVLTIISVVFIPLTFIAGVYGMNFNTSVSRWNMPELNMRYGYVGCWAVMLLIALVELYYFWKKGWMQSAVGPMQDRHRKAYREPVLQTATATAEPDPAQKA